MEKAPFSQLKNHPNRIHEPIQRPVIPPPAGRHIPEGSQGLSTSPRLENFRRRHRRTWKNVGKFWKIGKHIGEIMEIMDVFLKIGCVFENLRKSWNNLGNVGGNHEKLEHIGGKT